LLLRIGFPFLTSCYIEFFSSDLLDGLAVEFSRQLNLVLEVYRHHAPVEGIAATRWYRVFEHQIRTSINRSLLAPWEIDPLESSEETLGNFDFVETRKKEIERYFKWITWEFDCPICSGIETLICELDEDQLQEGTVGLGRAICASCDLRIHEGTPFMVHALCKDQITARSRRF
jgi:hypothetical protein